MLPPLRLAGDPLARLRDEAFDRRTDGLHAAIQRSIGGQLEVAPVAHRRQDSPRQRRENLVQVALDHVVVGLQCVDLRAEREAGDRVDREAHQVRLQIDPGAAGCRLSPWRDGNQRAGRSPESLVPGDARGGRAQCRQQPIEHVDRTQGFYRLESRRSLTGPGGAS
jgi:hypothetical protein